jgi:hypothetical protein
MLPDAIVSLLGASLILPEPLLCFWKHRYSPETIHGSPK